jgi:probable F420-dependent oxidoreductase
MHWWLNLSFVDVAHYVPLAVLAEECGFEGVVVSDHLVTPAEVSSSYPYGPNGATLWPPDAAWPDCWVAVVAMAGRTERLRFATAVYVAPLREPLALAKAISTASVFSNGRLAAGIGSGWMKEEFDVLDIPFETRADRMDEMLAVMKSLWTGELVEHHGRHFNFPAVQMRPRPHGDVPIYVGGHADRALQRAARHDGWIAAHTSTEETAADLLRIHRMLDDAGKPRSSFYVLATISSRRHVEEAEQLGRAGVDGMVVPAAVIERDTSLDARVHAIREFARTHLTPG